MTQTRYINKVLKQQKKWSVLESSLEVPSQLPARSTSEKTFTTNVTDCLVFSINQTNA